MNLKNRVYCFIVCYFGFSVVLADYTSISLKLSNETDVPLYVYKSDQSGVTILWLPSEAGLLEQEKKAARRLSKAGVNVWLADLHTAYFAPRIVSGLKEFKAQAVAQLIQHVLSKSNQDVFLVSSSFGAIPLLEGLAYWQQNLQSNKGDNRQAKIQLGGVVLISPRLYLKTPEPGLAGTFYPIVKNTNVALLILQPEKSPFYWQLPDVNTALSIGGSDITIWRLKDVRDRFYFRPDASQVENTLAAKLDWYLLNSIRLLQPFVRSRVNRLKANKSSVSSPSNTSRQLRKFKGKNLSPGLALSDLNGKLQRLSSLKGKVVLVNFWASWCPPCVHEMPSMQKLKVKFNAKGFEVLAVNMAEPINVVTDFLANKVKVNFTILLDKYGEALRRWQVYAFPSSYLIDKKGKIRYAVFGAIDWMDNDVQIKVKQLLNEAE